MKKNLILMTALFAGTMLINDGFCSKKKFPTTRKHYTIHVPPPRPINPPLTKYEKLEIEYKELENEYYALLQYYNISHEVLSNIQETQDVELDNLDDVFYNLNEENAQLRYQINQTKEIISNILDNQSDDNFKNLLNSLITPLCKINNSLKEKLTKKEEQIDELTEQYTSQNITINDLRRQLYEQNRTIENLRRQIYRQNYHEICLYEQTRTIDDLRTQIEQLNKCANSKHRIFNKIKDIIINKCIKSYISHIITIYGILYNLFEASTTGQSLVPANYTYAPSNYTSYCINYNPIREIIWDNQCISQSDSFTFKYEPINVDNLLINTNNELINYMNETSENSISEKEFSKLDNIIRNSLEYSFSKYYIKLLTNTFENSTSGIELQKTTKNMINISKTVEEYYKKQKISDDEYKKLNILMSNAKTALNSSMKNLSWTEWFKYFVIPTSL